MEQNVKTSSVFVKNKNNECGGSRGRGKGGAENVDDVDVNNVEWRHIRREREDEEWEEKDE